MLLTEEYINYYNQYKKQYGENVVVLMMVGSFYETYAIKGDGPNLFELSKLLNIQHTHRDKSKPESINNPQLVGFNMNSLEKFIEILVNNDYTVVVYDQKITLEPDAKKASDKRIVTRFMNGIYTRSTFINNLTQSENNYLLCVYIVNEDQKNSSPLKSSGLSCIDLSTGDVHVHSIFSNKYDENVTLEEISRFISNINPSEILIYYDNQSKTKKAVNKDHICGYLNVDQRKCRFYDVVDAKYKKINYQNEFLKKVYTGCDSMLSPIEYLSLEKEPNVIISLCLLFDFVYDKLPQLLKSVKQPNFCFGGGHLILGNNAISQLDIFENKERGSGHAKYNSLFSIVDHTRTNMGKRALCSILSLPLTSKTELNKMYDITQKFIDLKIPDQVRNHLDLVKDIERLARRMNLKMIRPYEIPLFVSSYESIVDIIRLLSVKEFDGVVKKGILKDIEGFIKYVNAVFNLDGLAMCIDTSFEKNVEIYKKGVHKEIDELNNNISLGASSVELLRDGLTALFPKTKSKFGNQGKITVKHNDRDGTYLKLSEKNGKELQKLLEKVKTLDVGKIKVATCDLQFSYNLNTAKIILPALDTHSGALEDYNEKIAELYKQSYLKDIDKIYSEFSDLFSACNEMVTNIDLYQSNAKCATGWGYCRPNIISKPYGYIDAKNARNPIVERLIEYEYVPSDICIGHPEFKTMMIYGLNSSGKSVYMRTACLCVYLAQCGMYVPASSFTYSPYNAIMTRISSNDDVFRNLSSFGVEMAQLNNILKRSDEYTLVVSDELCRSTENVSGTAIVASCIMSLTKKKSTNIITTHLHNIMDIDEIKEIDNIKAFHMKCTYDEKLKALVYDRVLLAGSGDAVYGVSVARYMINDMEFIDQANKIKNKLLQQSDSMISGKQSRYVPGVYMSECSLCGRKENVDFPVLESHHINHQADADEQGNVNGKPYMKLHSSQNIAILCNSCHDNVHANKKSIMKYISTSVGRKLVASDKS